MASHTATGEWQSFEIRMRRRRAERLLVRAEVAIESGFLDDADTAVAEAKRLAPSLPAIAAIEERIAAARNPSPVTTRRLPLTAGVAACGAVIAGIALTFFLPHRQPSAPISTDATSVAAAEPVSDSQPAARPASIHVETESVPPVVTRGLVQAPPESTPNDQATQPAMNVAPSTSVPPQPSPATDPRAVQASYEPEPRVPEPEPRVAALGTVAPVSRELVASTPASPLPPVETPKESPVNVPAPTSGTVPAPRTEAAPVRAVDETALVRHVLDQYAEAYTRLDAAAAQSVWPSVNRAALSRAFDGLSAQKISFNDCSVDLRTGGARAVCSGSATWQPKVGSSGPRTDPRRWAFDLQKSGDRWLIRDARVQNR